jgi:hypothetical protein
VNLVDSLLSRKLDTGRVPDVQPAISATGPFLMRRLPIALHRVEIELDEPVGVDARVAAASCLDGRDSRAQSHQGVRMR